MTAQQAPEAQIAPQADLQIDFSKMDGLVPGIVQDARSGELLMVGILNPESYQRTSQTGYVRCW